MARSIGFSHRKRAILYVVSLCLLTFLIYIPALTNAFVMDDLHVIVGNQAITKLCAFPTHLTAFFNRSLFYCSLSFDYFFFALNPWGYHLHNILLHILNGVLVFLLLRLLSQDVSQDAIIPIGGTCLFLLNPLYTVIINHISTRSIMLCALFYLVSILSYGYSVRSSTRRRTILWILISLGAYGAALGSKADAITLPLMILILSPWLHAQSLHSRKRFYPLAMVSFLIGMISLILLIHLSPVYQQYYHGPLQNLYTQLTVIPQYIAKFLLPIWLLPEYIVPIQTSFSLSVWWGVIFVLVYFITSSMLLSHKSLIGAGMMWFVIAIAPSSSIIPREVAMLMYRLYLPSIGLCIATISFYAQVYQLFFFRRKYMHTLFFICCLLIYGGVIIHTNALFHTNQTLWRAFQKHYPQSAIPDYNIGSFLLKEGKIEEALPFLLAATTKDPSYYHAFIQLGTVYFLMQDFQDAYIQYSKALALNPQGVSCYLNMGNTLCALGKRKEGIAYYKRYLQYFPDDIKAYHNLFFALKDEKNYTEAQHIISRLLLKEPHNTLYQKERSLLPL